MIYNRQINCLNKYYILSNSQYGVRKGRSTSLDLIDLYDIISSSIDRGQFSIGVFLHVSKAFETVDHSLFLDKLEHLWDSRTSRLQFF